MITVKQRNSLKQLAQFHFISTFQRHCHITEVRFNFCSLNSFGNFYFFKKPFWGKKDYQQLIQTVNTVLQMPFFPLCSDAKYLQPLCKSCSDKHKNDTRSHCVGPGNGSVDKALKCLQGKHDSVSSGLQHPHKHPSLVAHTYNPNIQEVKTGRSRPKTYG